jgi:hypothetical protein
MLLVVCFSCYFGLIASISTTPLTASIVVKTKPNVVDEFTNAMSQKLSFLTNGVTGFIKNYQRAQRLKELKKKKGDHALSFDEFKFLESSNEDLSKCFRLGITLPLSPEFFFYSYIVLPMMNSNNPWAWIALPSSFDQPEMKKKREEVVVKKRIQI